MVFSRWIKKERIDIHQIEMHNPKKELTIFSIYAVLYIFIVYIFSLAIKYEPLPILNSVNYVHDFWYVVCIKFIFLLSVPLFIYRKMGYRLSTLLGFKNENMKKNIFLVFIFFMIGILINTPVLWKILNHIHLFKVTSLWSTLVGILLPFFQAAVPEELFYRVILQTRIEKCYGWFLSIIVSSILFTLFHFPSRMLLASGVEGKAGNLPSVILGTLIPVFIIGVIFGFLWNRYRNVLLNMALHYGIDLLPSLAFFMGLKY